jgi:hypothetical protein
VSDKQQRTPPDDPWAITLTYRHEQPWWYGADDALGTWHVSADISDGEPGADAHVGDISITLVDLYQTHDPFALLDGADAELGRIAEALFDPDDGQLDPKLDERLEPAGDRILILHSVRLTPQWRGFGFGALLAGTAIRKLSGGARAAVCYPAPLGGRDEPGHDDPPDDHGKWEHAVASLRRVWGRLGFTHFRDGVHFLDLNLVTLDEQLAQLRRHAERYSTSGSLNTASARDLGGPPMVARTNQARFGSWRQ